MIIPSITNQRPGKRQARFKIFQHYDFQHLTLSQPHAFCCMDPIPDMTPWFVLHTNSLYVREVRVTRRTVKHIWIYNPPLFTDGRYQEQKQQIVDSHHECFSDLSAAIGRAMAIAKGRLPPVREEVQHLEAVEGGDVRINPYRDFAPQMHSSEFELLV